MSGHNLDRTGGIYITILLEWRAFQHWHASCDPNPYEKEYEQRCPDSSG
jgi:hypothetical protein